MRHGPVLSAVLGAVAISPLVAGSVGGPEPSTARAPGDPAAALKAAGRESGVVAYRGLRIPVPAGWAVHRLDQDPGRCVRNDERAIYLGTPGDAPDCPSRVVGGADVLRVEPIPPAAESTGSAEDTGSTEGTGSTARRPHGRAPVRTDRLAHFTIEKTVDHQARVRVPEAGVVISGSYGPDPSALEDLIRATKIDAGWGRDDPDPDSDPDPDPDSDPGPSPSPSPSPTVTGKPETETEPTEEPAPAEVSEKAWAKGKGFDSCTAPSVSAMRAWRSAFSVSNMYIGGASRGCAQPNLNRKWVRAVRAMGYRLTPTYVGLQAPCSRYRTHFTAKNATKQGRKAAVDAIRKAKALGIPERKPIYYDMEAYSGKNEACRKAVLRFLHSWSRKLKAERYVPAVYSSVNSAIGDLVKAEGIVQPDAIWFAHWDGKESLYSHPAIPDHRWHPHRRIKQYRGGHKETHGGVTINIDSNNVDGRVY
ncbi:DUF1906 domain-containing protein [Actinomadura sp. 9N407]|uniref:DUF1906 domain-containing protein n=1 Tax=Actinomadura sp. 9N407 TaxID=3375154 RepID=UPI0037B048E6